MRFHGEAVMMQKTFISRGKACNVDIFSSNNSYIFRFYDGESEAWDKPLCNLAIVPSNYGFLYLRLLEGDAILSGCLDEAYFSKDMVEDILLFVEDCVPACKDAYLPYHIDFAALSDYDEYNGEY